MEKLEIKLAILDKAFVSMEDEKGTEKEAKVESVIVEVEDGVARDDYEGAEELPVPLISAGVKGEDPEVGHVDCRAEYSWAGVAV